MKKKFVLVDAETDGLYGRFLTVAMSVIDEEGREIDSAYWGIKKENLLVEDSWVLENVVPILGAYEPCADEEELLEKVWNFWLKYQEEAYAVADVPYPVEHRLFCRCVEKKPEERVPLAPFPLLDLASMLFVQGIDPLTDRRELLEAEPETEQNVHNAAFDAEMTGKILQRIRKG